MKRSVSGVLALALAAFASAGHAQLPPPGTPSIVINTTPVTGGTNGNCLYINLGTVGQQGCGITGLVVGTTTIAGGSTGRILYDNSGALGELTTTGTGTVVVLATSPAIATPNFIGAVAVSTAGSLSITNNNVFGVGSPIATFNSNGASELGFQMANTSTGGRTYQIVATGNASGLGGGLLAFYDAVTGGVPGVRMIIGATGGINIGALTDPGAGSLQLNAQFFVPNVTTSSSATSGTVCWTTGTGKFTVDTTVGCLTSIAAAKTILSDIDPSEALAKVARLDAKWFRYKAGYGDGGRYEQPGFIADQVAVVDERLVGRDPEGTLSGVRYQEMTAVLASAIKQLKTDNDNLRRRVDDLENQMAVP